MNRRSTVTFWTLMCLGCLLSLQSPATHAAAFVPPPNPPRYLFVIEKSARTRSTDMDLPQTMFDLVYHGANGYLPDGGVFEIWLFGNETIFRGFAPQMLLPRNHLPLASQASAYVRTTKSEGTADVAAMMEHLHGAAEQAMELTVILVTAPETRLTGTGQDAEINAILEANSANQIQSNRPFITSIRIQDGKIAAWQVNNSAFAMSIPPMPASKLTIEERERRIAEARHARYEKEHPAPVPSAEAESNPVKRVSLDIPDDEREGAIILRGNPQKETSTETPKTVAGPAAKSAENPTEEELATPPAQPKVAEVETAPDAPAEAGPTSAPPPEDKAVSSTSKAAPPAETKSPGGQESPVPTNETSKAKAAPIPTIPVTNPTNAVPPTALAVPAKTWFTVGGLFVAGLCFFVVAALLAWVLMRRTRPAAGPSYITRSIEDRRK